MSFVEFREEALSFDKVVSFEARRAGTVFGMRAALVRNWHASTVSINKPPTGAF
jgi:hypothetical protein